MDKRYGKLQQLASVRAARILGASAEAEVISVRDPDATPILPAVPMRDFDEISRRLASATKAAAVSGRFDPLQLFREDESSELRSSVLTLLAHECVMPVGSETKWLLSSTRRKTALEEARSTMDELLTGQLPDADPFGAALRETLRSGSSADLTAVGRTEALQALSAVKFVEQAGLPIPDPSALEQAVSRSNFLADYRSLLTAGFYGRKGQLRRLRGFLKQRKASADSIGWSSLVLSGLGGAGKSTLLAHYLEEVASTSQATIAVLDFDRPGIDPSEAHLLELEIVRHFGYQLPELEPELREARENVREFRGTLGGESFSSDELESSDRELRSLLRNARSILVSRGFSDRPVLLVLDTLEEVIVAGLAAKLVGWLNAVQEAIEPLSLKVVFSGRLAGYYGGDIESLEELPPEIEAVDPQKILLGELPRHASLCVLMERGVRRKDAEALLEEHLIPRRPLELRLLGRLFAEASGLTAREIVEDVRSGGPTGRQMFSALVYRRVLQRIHDEDVRKLANPGLVLRYIDDEIVSAVLLPALGLDMSKARIARATAGLGGYAWLAVRRPDGTIWHRRDLRRSMLKAMISQEPEATRSINMFAADYFRGKSDAASQSEFLYHSLMLAQTSEDVARFPLASLKEGSKGFSADIADLPLVAQVGIRYAQQLSIKSEHLVLLPSEHREKALNDAGRRFVAAREFGQAADLTRSTSNGRFRAAAASETSQRWVVEALFATVDWREMFSFLPRLRRPPTTLKQLSDQLYPMELGTDRQGDDGILSLLGRDLKIESIVDSALEMADGGGTYTARLAVVLALISRKVDLDFRIATLAGRLVDADENAALSPGLGPRQLLLVAIGDVRRPVRFRLRASQLQLDPSWLVDFAKTLSAIGEGAAIPVIDDTLSTVTELFAEATPSIGRLLAKIDADETSRKTGRMQFRFRGSDWQPEMAERFLRGPTPELRDPLRYALADVSDGNEASLAELVAEVLPVEFKETRSKPFRKALETDAAKALSLPLEIIDRMGRTRELVSAALTRFPDGHKLRHVAASYDRLDQAVDKVFRRFGK